MMEWIPALTTTGLFAILTWLARNLIASRLTNAIRHEYDVKIENLRDELGKKQKQIEALRSGALSGVVNRQSVLYQRQVDAVDQLWSGVIQMSPAKNIATSISSFKFENTVKAAAENPNLRKIFEIIEADFDRECLSTPSASKARPFVTPMSWAYFAAYHAVLGHYVAKILILKSGLTGASKFIENDKIKEIIKTALPHRSDYIDQYGHEAFYHLIDELEEFLLQELRRSLDGSQANEESVKQANQILAVVENLQSNKSK